jgi:hypothetical protein
VALTEQQTLLAVAPHCLLRQVGSRQSGSPSQLLSMPSLQISAVPVAHLHPVPPSVSVPQVKPGPHCAKGPHMHEPASQPVLRPAVQVVQVAPLVPQALVLVPATQVLPLQQPVQVAGSHTQVLAWHFWPTAQAAVAPQRQVPVLEQLSDSAALQAAQLLAWVPQLAVVGGLTQLVPLQQPASQLTESHTQLPPTQCWPVPQAGPAPQEQLPPSQPSAMVELQVEQPAPEVPHWARVGGATQVAPEQQPLAQLQPTHCWLVQVWPPQDAQVAPPVPHWVLLVPVWQTPEASQQPVGQLVASQTQRPPEQRWPVAQTAPPPQEQAPEEVQRSERLSQVPQEVEGAPQAAVDWLEEARQAAPGPQQPVGQLAGVQTQVPAEQTWPTAQAAPLPHLQAPVTQALVRPEQTEQAAPPVPQKLVPCVAPE